MLSHTIWLPLTRLTSLKPNHLLVLPCYANAQLAEAGDTLEQCLADAATGLPPRPDTEALARHKA